MGAISVKAQGAANAVTGDAGAMIRVPEIEGDPVAIRKLAVAVFNLADALKLADQEIRELRAEVQRLRR